MNDEAEARKKKKKKKKRLLCKQRVTESSRRLKRKPKWEMRAGEGEKNKAQHQKLTSRSFRQKVRQMF